MTAFLLGLLAGLAFVLHHEPDQTGVADRRREREFRMAVERRWLGGAK